MAGAFTNLGNHLVSDSASAINAGDDESIIGGAFRGMRGGGPRRRRQDDDDETDVFDEDDVESLSSMAVDGRQPGQAQEVQLPPHACA